MINIWIVLGILFFHWIFDFVFQTHEQSLNKSSSWTHLLSHTLTYSLGWAVICVFYSMFAENILFLLFPLITFLAHTATDYYTSKVNSQLYKENRIHDFFVSIGFDQFLHFSQLLLTFYLLT